MARGSIAYSPVTQPRPGALAPARHALGDARRAEHPGVAELDQHRALRVDAPVPGHRHRAELVGLRGHRVGSCHQPTLSWSRDARAHPTPRVGERPAPGVRVRRRVEQRAKPLRAASGRGSRLASQCDGARRSAGRGRRRTRRAAVRAGRGDGTDRGRGRAGRVAAGPRPASVDARRHGHAEQDRGVVHVGDDGGPVVRLDLLVERGVRVRAAVDQWALAAPSSTAATSSPVSVLCDSSAWARHSISRRCSRAWPGPAPSSVARLSSIRSASAAPV